MPELPEVETIARQLAKKLKKQKLLELRLLDPKLREFSTAKFSGKTLLQLKRSGKEILFSFSEELSLRVHLRMTGRLVWISGLKKIDSQQLLVRKNLGDVRPKSIRAEFLFDNGILLFEDVRRFGTFKLGLAKEESKWIDPTTEEFSIPALTQLLKGSKQQIKTWLLRQDKLVGIGNIYASEILFRSGISPDRAAGSLSDSETKKLYGSTKYILEKAIELNGTTFSDYRDSRGETGGFQNFLKVYNREGEKCRKCKDVVICMRQGQRSTYFCGVCQK